MNFHDYFILNKDTGDLTFKFRSDMSPQWNGQWAGKVAGYIVERPPNRYVRVGICGLELYAHRVVFEMYYGFEPDNIDHINGNGLDNRPCNLRSVSTRINNMNLRKRSNNSSGITGVSFDKRKSRLRSYINVKEENKKTRQIFLGYFDDFFEACCARKSAERKYGFHLNHGRQS